MAPISRRYFGVPLAWWIVAACGLGLMFCVGSFIAAVFSQFVKPLEENFGWSRTELSAAPAIISLSMLVLAPLAGAIVDRYGAFRLILFSAVAFPAALVLFTFQSGVLWHFYASVLLIAIAGIGGLPTTYTAVIVRWFDGRRGLALGLALAGTGLATVLLPPTLQLIIEQRGWQTGGLVLAAMSFIVVFPAVFLLRLAPSGLHEIDGGGAIKQSTPSQTHTPVAAAPRRPMTFRIVVLGMIFFVFGIGTVGPIIHMMPLLMERGLSGQTAARMIATLGIGLLLARIIVGLLLDKFRPNIVAWLVLSGPGLGLLMLGSTDTVPLMVFAVLLMAVGYGAEFDIMSFFVSRLFAPNLYGRLHAIVFASYTLGGALGPLLVSQWMEQSKGYEVPLSALGLCLLVAAVAFLALPVRRPQSVPA